MKHYSKTLLAAGTLFLFLLQSCVSLTGVLNQNKQTCDGKSILTFQSHSDILTEHRTLYQRYLAGAEEDSVLINYEMEKAHYSLRKKDNDMDDGLRPDEPDFDPFVYTSDDILEVLLNEDGIVIIGNELYMWDDGCVIMKIPYSCNNYKKLLEYRNLVTLYQQNPTDQNHSNLINHRIINKISEVNSCSDVTFDLEFMTEEGLNLEQDIQSLTSRSSGCGYDVFIHEQFISNDPLNKKIRYRITTNSIQTPGTNPISFLTFNNITGSDQVTIIDNSNTLTTIHNNCISYLDIDNYSYLFCILWHSIWPVKH